jgi:cystathionine beta-lyase/cystathionine gamma-synthase
MYIRGGNSARAALEELVTCLKETRHAFTFSSGGGGDFLLYFTKNLKPIAHNYSNTEVPPRKEE